jgi:hypothetical protein
MSDEVIKKLEARIAELEAKVNPEPKAPFVPKPYQQPDYTEGASSVVTDWMRDMARAVPTSVVRDIVNDFRGGPAQLQPLSEFLNKGRPVAEPPKAEAPTVPVDSKRPGQDLADAIAIGFANREKAEELAKLVDVANKLKGL